MQNKFPEKGDYPESLDILDNPYKDINLYMRLCVSSASAYFETDPFTRYLFKKRFYLVEDYIKNLIGRHFKKALDVGCGIGFFLPILASLADKVTALDYTGDVLEYARFMVDKRNIKNVDFKQADVKSMPFEDKLFDLISCMSVLEHFQDLESPLRELKRVLAPGGFLVVGYPTETPLFRFLHKKASRIVLKRRKINKIFESERPGEAFAAPHLSDERAITQAIYSAGFHEKGSRSINLLPPFLKLYTIKFLKSEF